MCQYMTRGSHVNHVIITIFVAYRHEIRSTSANVSEEPAASNFRESHSSTFEMVATDYFETLLCIY
jgi:hypothetical protein